MRKLLTAALLVSFLGAVSARTQTPAVSTLAVKTDVKREVRVKGPDGQEQVKYENFRQAKKDDILVLTLTYTNGGDKDDQSAIVYNIRPDSIFVDASGANTAVQVSADGGKNWALHPATFRIKGPDGKTIEKPVPLERITNVRWVFAQPVKPGQSGQLTLKIKAK